MLCTLFHNYRMTHRFNDLFRMICGFIHVLLLTAVIAVLANIPPMRKDMRMRVDDYGTTHDTTDSSTVEGFEHETENWGVDWMSSTRRIWDEEFSSSANEQLANHKQASSPRRGADAGNKANEGTMVNHLVRWFNRQHF